MKNLIFISLLFLFSCTKEKSILVTATNPSTGEPFANLDGVLIERNFNTSGQSNGVGVEVLHFQTDANGQALITYNFNKKRYYEVYLSPPSNYCYASDGFKKVFSENSQDMDKIDYSFIPCSYINLYINNLNCQSVDDSLILFQRDEMNIHDDGTTPWYHIGCINWQSNGTSDFVMGWHFFRWEVIRSGVKEIYTDSFYVDEGDTVNYILNY